MELYLLAPNTTIPEGPLSDFELCLSLSRQGLHRYEVWTSHSCWVCSNGTGIPTYHASRKGYSYTSPCDRAYTVVWARNRSEAIRVYKKRDQ